MYLLKRFAILITMIAVALTVVSAQSSGRPMTVEESYLMETMEVMIIRELAGSNNWDQKLRSLEYIGDAINRGNTNDEIRRTLENLAGEGTRIVARENGRVVNNFPDVRRQAARYLGQLGSEEARQSLIGVLQVENEPAVIQEVIKSLGDIGLNPNNETVIQIGWIFRRYNNLNPDNIMALATIDAFDKITRASDGAASTEVIQVLMLISEGNYITPVRDRARQLIAELRSYNSN